MSRAKLRRYFRHGLFPQLLVFEAVARLGSVTRAAQELHLAQPTVSVQLKKLAETLELSLFEQRGRKLYLTAPGEELRRVCEELSDLFGRAEAQFERYRKLKGVERVRLAAEPEAKAVAARLLAAFCSRHPGIQASLHIAERAELLGRLAEGVDDVYLFDLEAEGVPVEHRLSVVHAKGRELARSAALFLREALHAGAYNRGGTGEAGGDGNTTRVQRGDGSDRA